MKTRVVRKYSPYCGTWWVIQVKLLFWWVTAPRAYKSLECASHYSFGDIEELFEKPVSTVEMKFW